MTFYLFKLVTFNLKCVKLSVVQDEALLGFVHIQLVGSISKGSLFHLEEL